MDRVPRTGPSQRQLALSGLRRAAPLGRPLRGHALPRQLRLRLRSTVALCRWCHDQTDAPYERGRLVVTALGAGQFTFEVVARVGSTTLPPRVPAFAHVGKVQPVDDKCDSGLSGGILPTWAK